MKILIIALSGIGDALMFTPALRLLRKTNSSVQIDALVMIRGVRDIYQTNPDFNKIIYFDFLKEGFLKSIKFLWSLRKKYNATINVYPSNRKEYNVINFLIGAEKRVAVKYLRMNNSCFGWLNNITVKEDDSIHNVRENIRLVEKLLNKKFDEEPGLQIQLSESDKKFAQTYLNENGILANDLIIGFHPGCATIKNHIKRRWEPDKFAALGKKLIDSNSAKILLFGGPEENELKEDIHKKINSNKAIIVNTPDLLKSAAIMERCNVFVTNDSSLMHIASALRLKVVAIIGPTGTNYIHPWKTNYKIVSLELECAPCFNYSPKPLACTRTDIKFKCIKNIDIDMVYHTTIKHLD